MKRAAETTGYGRLALVLPVLWAFSAPQLRAETPASCPIAKATYRPVGQASHELQFAATRENMAGIEATLRWTASGETLVFDQTSTSGYMIHRLFPRDERFKDNPYEIYFFDAAMTGTYVAGSDVAAPPYAFLPRLPLGLWYQEFGPRAGDAEPLPMNMWVLSCRTK